jgi:LysM repeat protein
MHKPRHARPSSRRPLAAAGVTALAASALAVPLTSHGPAPEAKVLIEPVRDASHVQHVTRDVPAAHLRSVSPGTVTVRPGDTLSAIAGRVCGDPASYLALAYNNGLANPDLIYAGQVFKVACQAAAQAVADRYGLPGSAPARHYAPQSAPQSPPPSPPQGAAVVTSVSGTFSCTGLEQLWGAAGGNPADALVAAEVAMAESGGNPNAVSPTDDFGLWQVNASNGDLATLSPAGSAHSAVVLSGNGTDWSAWTTFRTGAYAGLC